MPHTEAVLSLGVPIAPPEPTDVNPTHIAEYGRGGLHSVADITARNAIGTDRKKIGMLVYVQSESKYYTLTALPSTWTEFAAIPSVITTQTAFLSSNVTMTNATSWYTALTLSLTSGTWLIIGSTSTSKSTSQISHYDMRIHDGSAALASSQTMHSSHADSAVGMSCSAIVTLASTTSITLDVAASTTGCVVNAATSTMSSPKATVLNAVRIA